MNLNGKRLAAIMAVALLGVNTASAQRSSIGPWTINIETDPINDSVNGAAIRSDEENERGIMIRCQNLEVDFVFVVGEQLDSLTVISRSGDADPIMSEWVSSVDETAVFHPNPRRFLGSLLGGNRLVLRVEAAGRTETSIFNLRRFSEVIDKMSDECGIEVATRGWFP